MIGLGSDKNLLSNLSFVETGAIKRGQTGINTDIDPFSDASFVLCTSNAVNSLCLTLKNQGMYTTTTRSGSGAAETGDQNKEDGCVYSP